MPQPYTDSPSIAGADTPLVVIQAATKSYGGQRGVEGMSLTVPRGQIVAICGANGSGKTTTLAIVAGLLFADQGTMRFDGATIPLGRTARRPGLGFLGDTPFVDGDLTGWQWIRFVAGIKASTPSPDTQSHAERLGLGGDALHRPIHTLSFGTQRKVALWAELSTTERLLVLDEPLIGMDPPSIEGFHAALRAFVSHGRSVILSTHLLREAEAIATYAVVIRDGRCAREGAIGEITGGRSLSAAFADLVAAA